MNAITPNEMTAKNLKIRKDWLIESRKFLKNYPEKVTEFERLWDAEKYQEAYLFIHELIQSLNIKRSGEYEKINENFYWLLR
jgi:hypothetical protein